MKRTNLCQAAGQGSDSHNVLSQGEDDTLRNTAVSKQDSRILALSRDLVAAEGQYHRSCYRSYTRTRPHVNPTEIDEYAGAMKESFQKLFANIREDAFENPRINKLTELTMKLTNWMLDEGKHIVKYSTKKHLRRYYLGTEVEQSLQFVQDAKGKVLVYPVSLSQDALVKQNVTLMDTLEDLELKCDITGLLKQPAHLLHNSMNKHSVSISWPPLVSELTDSSAFIPGNLKEFLQQLIAGSQDEASLSPRIQHLFESIGQDIVYEGVRGQLKPPKHFMLPYAIKSLTGLVELIGMISRLGHGVSYTQAEELETALCMQKLESQRDESVAIPEQIQPHIPATVG